MSDCRYGVSPINYPDPDPGFLTFITCKNDVTPSNVKETWSMGRLTS